MLGSFILTALFFGFGFAICAFGNSPVGKTYLRESYFKTHNIDSMKLNIIAAVFDVRKFEKKKEKNTVSGSTGRTRIQILRFDWLVDYSISDIAYAIHHFGNYDDSVDQSSQIQYER
ncbi:hypothetical protein B9Z55_017919 [Caenorhabditis nigoni]|uniref:Uncharacterized protein n=1 Tax=Caenorhabditis nigoni TaxID=1611254 RepID=A0A2G5TBU9_9PELO|nr:hypothetical protein B9Z55_017919 [Caenorhabditis nigoni]